LAHAAVAAVPAVAVVVVEDLALLRFLHRPHRRLQQPFPPASSISGVCHSGGRL